MPIAGSRRRARGYVAEAVREGVVVNLYPVVGDEITERIVSAAELRVLKAGLPKGWFALHLLTPEGEPHISLRFRPEVIATLKCIAAERGTGLEETINHLLHVGLERHAA